jgi:hypothetical protein
MRELITACGLDPAMVTRLVIDLPVDNVARIYVTALPPHTIFGPLVKLVSDIHISEKGEITTTPLSLTDTSRMLANAVLAGELEAARALADDVIEHCGGK